ncbi:uncharacterized protein LOC106095754 [Stomoxys calcitrans]|uniref:Uncharacterized protein n=1 Tax=Stomoxys calcitrans TaxID=35570 RepID=A0A1I8P9L7_STOCA|nr:uncharacterized protein LOC106095754 [Stomoxys calcitrans]XP_059223467.1 uncharacterized protein LOC106095754 [Stomoxys calcitrans]
MAGSAVARLASKYGAVIFFPSFTAATIFADWSHTQNWKKTQREIAKVQELLKHQ